MKQTSRIAIVSAALMTLTGHAGAQVIRFTNASNLEVPLKAGSSVQVDSSGNLIAECVLANGTCSGLPTGSAAGAPTGSLSRVDGDPEVHAGESVKLAWSSSGAKVCQASSTGPANNWSGPRTTANGSGETITVVTQGSYVFKLLCFNEAGASPPYTVAVNVLAGQANPPPAADDCTLDASTPLVQPAGWTRIDKSWSQLFADYDGSPMPTYPSSFGYPVPIGANKGTYVAASFTAGADQTVSIFWDPMQAKPEQGYYTARPAQGMFISVSPCAGDLRPADGSGGFLMAGCRRYNSSAGITYSTKSTLAASNFTACKLQAGKKYYINVLPADPTDGLSAGEHSCSDTPSSANACDVQARSSLL
jgi:hypothetical protein